MDSSQHPLSDTAAKAHAFLFVEGGSLTWKRLAQLLGCNEGEARQALDELSRSLQDSGLTVMMTDEEAALSTSARVSESIKTIFDAQLQRDIGDAGLEVLATLLYRGPSTRAEIDYIRGVNTTSTVRTLLSRGLIERSQSTEDAREYVYRPTPELLVHLGVSRVEELPDYATIRSELAAFENSIAPFTSYAAGAGQDEGDA